MIVWLSVYSRAPHRLIVVLPHFESSAGATSNQAASTSTVMAHFSAPGPRVRVGLRPSSMATASETMSPYRDRPFRLSGSRLLHLRSCCNDFRIKERGEEDEDELLLLLLLLVQARSLFVYRRATGRGVTPLALFSKRRKYGTTIPWTTTKQPTGRDGAGGADWAHESRAGR